ncbi:MAG TPA: hypothetical protein ENN99_04190 [Chloroflexi bacterium]|nr:hypothetical protein [Chloroflexota bacterium]
MRLNHLVLQGYKSFATKTEFLFTSGITAIVGPNGSGKSNIADAIRWVLGEQRMSMLRGKSTSDMIFAGGQRRARAGMAEVSLTFDNADGWLPIEFTEVTLARRAYRSGENEYLINGSRVRLRDIAELLSESGLGRSAYVVIGQGLVDAALSLRPQERRVLLEEAAGISLYRDQREAAVGRLDETQRNLERVHDIVNEITPRLHRLARESERVEEYRRLVAHLERLQRTWYGYHWGRQQRALDRSLRVVAVLQDQFKARESETATLEQRLVELRQREGELRADLRDWHRASADLHDQMNDVQRELAVAEERSRLLKVRREELLAEMGPLTEQQESQRAKMAQVQAQVERMEQDLAARQERLRALEREWALVEEQAQTPLRQRAEVEQEMRRRRAGWEGLNQALFQAREEAVHLASEQAVAEERGRQVQMRYEKTLAEVEPLRGQRDAQRQRVDETRAGLAEWEHRVAGREQHIAALEREWAVEQRRSPSLDQQRESVEQELRQRRANREGLNQALVEARAEAASLAGELEALERMYATGAAYDAGVQAVMQSGLAGVLGPLASLLRVSPPWEQAVEAVLGPDLQAVVVEGQAVVRGVRRLLESTGGRVTLLPLDGLRAAPTLPPGAARGGDVAACDERVRPAVEAVLGGVALCQDEQAARRLLPDMPPGGRCVTPEGLVLRAEGGLSLGRVEVDRGVLAEARLWQRLPEQLEEVRRRCREIEEQQREEDEQIAALKVRGQALERQAAAEREEREQAHREAIGKAQTELAVAREALRSQQAALRREESLLDQLEVQVGGLRQQADELEAERAAIAARVQGGDGAAETAVGEGFQVRLADVQRRIQELEGEQQAEAGHIEELEAQVQALSQAAAAASEEAARVERETVGPARTEAAVAEEMLRSHRTALEREESLLERLQAQLTARHQRIQELGREQAAIDERIQALRAETARLEGALDQARTRIQPAEGELAHLRENQADLEKQVQRSRDRVRDTETRLGRAELDVARCRDELEMLGRRIEEDLGLVELELAESVTAQTPLPLRPLVSQLPVVEMLPEGLDDEIQRLKAHLRRLGSVNPNAPEDYIEVEERHRFLTEQLADLERASAQLRQVVAELDDVMAAAFRETFDAVAARFSEVFTALFNGGSARLELTEPEELLSTGVDIVARPPGKRAQRLALLSGGERALTAVALLFSILHVSPTPFCVLDEVDAMLDEANVGRFRTLLQELAEQTQFIVITHNRVTTEAAHTIYGVSMGADAVSQVVSLELEA